MPKEHPGKGIAWALAMGVGVSAEWLQGMDQRQLQLPAASFPQIFGQEERGLHIRQSIAEAQPNGSLHTDAHREHHLGVFASDQWNNRIGKVSSDILSHSDLSHKAECGAR